MPHLLVRDLDADTVERLKARAKRHGRSLQGEVKTILEQAAALTVQEAREVAQQWHGRLKGRRFTDSAKSIREDRGR